MYNISVYEARKKEIKKTKKEEYKLKQIEEKRKSTNKIKISQKTCQN